MLQTARQASWFLEMPGEGDGKCPLAAVLKSRRLTLNSVLMPRRRRKPRPYSLLRRLWRISPFLLIASLLIAAVWQVKETGERQAFVYAGVPRQMAWNKPEQWVHILRNPGFLVAYSEIRRNPLWVAYRAKEIRQKQSMPRPKHFSTDYRSLLRVSQDDYSRSGFDRGHMAPNYLISQLYGHAAQYASFRMTNITPQRQELNREFWQRVEEVEVDYYARWFKELWVITGPVFDERRQFLASGVEIPDGFFKIMLDIDRAGRPRVLALLVPQEVRGNTPFEQLVVTVDQIEQITGFDFFPEMEDGLEAELESSSPDHHWRLKETGRMPSRYKVTK